MPPFLPARDEPPAAKPAERASLKTLLLWVVLIMVFLAIWQFMTPSQDVAPGRSQGHAPVTPVCPEASWFTPGVAVVAIFVVFAGLAFTFLRRLRASATFVDAQEQARRAMAQRNFGAAAEAYLTLAKAHAGQPMYEAAALSGAAYACLWAGRFDEAVELYRRIEGAQGLAALSGVRTGAAAQLVILHALMGKLDDADQWLAAARDRLKGTRDDRHTAATYAWLGDAILKLRRGEPTEAVKLLDQHWLTFRDLCNANMMRAIELIRAFAESSDGPRAQNLVSERLLRVQPIIPGEFAFLGAAWDEMQFFLDAHGAA